MISVIVCTYNREKLLASCIDSLVHQDCHPGDYEIILINNCSTDNTEKLCINSIHKHPGLQIRYFLETKQGLSNARNRGIRESMGNIITFIDDDAFAEKDYIYNIKKDFRTSGIAAGGGKIIPNWEKTRPKWMSRFLLPLVSVIDLGDQIIEFKGNKYPIGANMFFRKSLFEKSHFFDPMLGRSLKNMIGNEEKDLFLKIKKLGYKISYFPSITVRHYIPEERTKISFIKKQALGIGQSEKIRTRLNKKERIHVIFNEIIKWGGTIILSFFYILLFDPQKAKMLLLFRYWVSKGLLSTQNKND